MKGFPGFSLYFLQNKVKDKEWCFVRELSNVDYEEVEDEYKKTSGFNEQNDSFALSSHFFVTHFLLNFVVTIFRFIVVIAWSYREDNVVVVLRLSDQ